MDTSITPIFSPKFAKKKIETLKEKLEREKPLSVKQQEKILSTYSKVEKRIVCSRDVSSIFNSHSTISSLDEEKEDEQNHTRYLDLISEQFKQTINEKIDNDRKESLKYRTIFPEYSNKYTAERIYKDRQKMYKKDYIRDEQLFGPPRNDSISMEKSQSSLPEVYHLNLTPTKERSFVDDFNSNNDDNNFFEKDGGDFINNNYYGGNDEEWNLPEYIAGGDEGSMIGGSSSIGENSIISMGDGSVQLMYDDNYSNNNNINLSSNQSYIYNDPGYNSSSLHHSSPNHINDKSKSPQRQRQSHSQYKFKCRHPECYKVS